MKTLEQAHAWVENTQEKDIFSPHQKMQMTGHLTVLQTNKIGLKEQKTRLYPANLSHAIFIHVVEDLLSGAPRVLGWHVLCQGAVVEKQTWVVASEEELTEVLQNFTEQFLSVWNQSIEAGQGPHVFHFGARCWQVLKTWREKSDLSFLWAPNRLHSTDLRQLLSLHFDLPVPGNLTLFALNHLLGLQAECHEPESLFHFDDSDYVSDEEWIGNGVQQRAMAAYVDVVLGLQKSVWQWASSHLTSEWEQGAWEPVMDEGNCLQTAYLDFLEEERRLREEDVLTLQAHPLDERVERFRSIGPIRFQKTTLDDEGRFLYEFQTEPEIGFSKFREGDFLKLAPVGLPDIQGGLSVILMNYERLTGHLWVQSRQGRLALNQRLLYSLEEDLTDWNGPKLVHAVQTVFSKDHVDPLSKLLSGQWITAQEPDLLEWVQNWLQNFEPLSELNKTQQQALILPFKHRLSLIEGPPGTGKTHLLGWILVALILQAQEEGRPLRIAVGALTHQAIDHVLNKVCALVEQHGIKDFSARCFKWGRQEDESLASGGVVPLEDTEMLAASPYAILGATGFGLYQLFDGRKGTFPQVFDWIVFDEASQLLVPQALLSLLYGKGNFLFLGDPKQLPPIVLGNYEAEESFGIYDSVLTHFLAWFKKGVKRVTI